MPEKPQHHARDTVVVNCGGSSGKDCGVGDVDMSPRNPPLKLCYQNDPNDTILLVNSGDDMVERKCANVECLPVVDDEAKALPDPCGRRSKWGYGDPVYWENEDTSHRGLMVCLGDAYMEEECDRAAYDDAVKNALVDMPLPVDVVKEIQDECLANPDSAKNAVGENELTTLPLPPECYLGRLGGALVRTYSATEDVQLAKIAWGAAQASYEIQGKVCNQIVEEDERIEERQAAFASEMNSWRRAKLVADGLASAASNAAASASSYGASNLATVFQVMSLDLGNKMAMAQQDFDNFMRTQTMRKEINQCYAEANKLQAQFDVQKGQIVRRTTDEAAAIQEFERIQAETKRAYSEGDASLGREGNRTTPHFAFHYWYEEKAERYLREFAWAQKLVYLAMRAVEFEFQQSLRLRRTILTANNPDALEGAIRTMQAEVATRSINRRRPQELSVVLSLRDDILGIVDLSKDTRPGSRRSTPMESFRARLWDPQYSLYDKDGRWAGQGVPFTVSPQGALADRCAERLWRVTATVQGDGLSDSQPGAALRLLKKNTFSSQWCEGRSDGSSMQVGHLEPSQNLISGRPAPAVEGETNKYSTAAIYPWFNVRRSEFYKVAYQDGASEELAGRGLYGDYVLLFPAELLEGREVTNPPGGELAASFKIDKFPLDRVEDVLMRFDYLSVDNFAARSVQPNP